MDLYMNEINNKPAQIFFHYRNINISKFNGEYALTNLLNNFIGMQGNQENPLNFNIYSYMKRADFSQNIIVQEKNIKYLKINDHFFTYFSKNPISFTKYDGILLKITSILFHTIGVLNDIYFLLIKKMGETLFDRDENIVIVLLFVYIGFTIFGCCICACMKSTLEYSRIDIIFSNDYNKLFIGVTKNNNFTAYSAKFDFFLNSLERFVLQQNPNFFNSFYLEVINKGSNMVTNICYIQDAQIELEGLLYLLNERIINNNNNNNIDTNANNNIDKNNQQYFNENTPTPAE
jgi:hypothetical protein